MKRTIWFAAWLLVAVFGVAVSAFAQAGPVLAKVPFSFTVFDKTLTAGNYWVSATFDLIKIQDESRRVVAMASVNEVSERARNETRDAKGRLLFHCYEEQCFLSEIWFPARANGRRLFTSRAEANLAKEEKGTYFAVLWEK
jgi:hypothetical protein